MSSQYLLTSTHLKAEYENKIRNEHMVEQLGEKG